MKRLENLTFTNTASFTKVEGKKLRYLFKQVGGGGEGGGGEGLRHDHVLITVNIFSIKRK